MKRWFLLILAACVLAALIGGSIYGYFTYRKFAAEQRALADQATALRAIGEIATQGLVNEKGVNQTLADDNANLAEGLRAAEQKNEAFTTQIQEMSGTVGKLQKIIATPPELLKKYSKVYFLNEHYAPAPLLAIESSSLADPARGPQQVLAPVAPFLTRLLADAVTAERKLLVVSGYRSFGDQTAVKTGYKVLYGSGANQFSADQGYSEHQLGTAFDLATPGVSSFSLKFASSSAGLWLMAHAHEYGFILSYPKSNAYYQYEPWHWRFVGVALATRLHDEQKSFYDLSQREIDEYLVSIFD